MAQSFTSLKSTIDAAAQSALYDVAAAGVAVGVVFGGQSGTACAGLRSNVQSEPGFSNPPMAADSIFQIGSVTKVLTTGLFGQLVSAGQLKLDTELKKFEGGALPGLTSNSGLAGATLQDLATFMAGIPSTPSQPELGYLGRPSIADWGVGDFATWFAQQTYTGSYLYSDASVGMLGLLATAVQPKKNPLPADAVTGWFNALDAAVMQQLGMPDTVLMGLSKLSHDQTVRLCSGYQPAVLTADIDTSGAVSAINITSGGDGYGTPPVITFRSGGGTGASAYVSQLTNGRVTGVTIASGGSGYTSPPAVHADLGPATVNPVPVWAGAGAVSSTLNDMLVFAQACIEAVTTDNNPSGSLAAGLNLAMQSYGSYAPGVDYGMAWEIATGPGSAGSVISKLGGIPGFSTYIGILPAWEMGLVVFCNARQTAPNQQPTRPAMDVANQIISDAFN